MINELFSLLLKLNRLSTKTPEVISYQLRVLCHYDIEHDGLGRNYEIRMFRQNPKSNLPTIKYANIQECIDDIKARIGFYERKSRK